MTGAPRPVMIAVTVPLLLIAATLTAVVAIGGPTTDPVCADGWGVAARALPLLTLVAGALTAFAAIRIQVRFWSASAAVTTAGLALWFVVVSDFVTTVDTEPDAAPRSQQCHESRLHRPKPV